MPSAPDRLSEMPAPDRHTSPGVEDPRPALPPTAARILAAAQHVLVTRGFAGLTLKAIAAESGENSAMVQYYFGNKAGLVEAMIDSAFRDDQQAVAEIMSTVTGDDLLPKFVEGLRTISASESFRAFFEILPYAVRDERFKRRLAEVIDWYRQIKLDWLQVDERETPLPLDPAERGVMLARIGVPDVEALFADIPADKRIDGLVDLPLARSEMAVERLMSAMAAR